MDHVREHRSVLASAEKQLLVGMARRLPPWLSSDHLSLIGLLSMPAAGLAFAAIRITPWGAAAFAIALAVNWFGDSLDGTLARVRMQPRPRYGYYVDHVIDLVGAAALVAGMGASGLMLPSIAVAVLAAYCLVCAETFLATHAAGVFRLSFAGLGPTELRILLAIGGFYVSAHPEVVILGQRARLMDVSGVVTIAGLAIVFMVSAIRNTRALYLAEPLPPRSAVSTQKTQRGGELEANRSLCLRGNRRRRARGAGVADAQPRRARDRPPDRVAHREPHRARVDGKDAGGAQPLHVRLKPDTTAGQTR